MKKYLLLLFLFTFSLPLLAQDEEEDEAPETEEPSTKELGLDLNISASNLGGTYGLGLKFGVLQQEKFIFGPSIRYQRTWQNYNGMKGYSAIYGGGAFFHARLYDYFFLGAELEFLKMPFNYSGAPGGPNWVPVALVGGGFSRAFTPGFRLNAGIMYDLINHTNSPFRPGYFMKKENGVPIPVLYRVAFFFPL